MVRITGTSRWRSTISSRSCNISYKVYEALQRADLVHHSDERQKRWRRLRGFRYLAKMSADVRFINGMEEKETGEKAAGFRTAINQICRNSYKYPRRNVLMQLQDNDSYVLSTVNGKDDKSFY